MKKIIFIIVSVLIIGCDYGFQVGSEFPEGYEPDISEEIETVQDIQEWIGGNIVYKNDKEQHGTDDYWQTPAETVALGTGDCEDHAILMMWMLYEYLGTRNSYLAIITSEHWEKGRHHAVVLYAGNTLEPDTPMMGYDANIVFVEEVYTFWEVVEYAEDHGGPVWRSLSE